MPPRKRAGSPRLAAHLDALARRCYFHPRNPLFINGLHEAAAAMAIRFHEGDAPEGYDFGAAVAIDTETMGLEVGRDRLCVVQLSRGDGDAEVVRIAPGQRAAPRITAML